MSSFYLSDPKVLNELKLLDEDFRIYQHCCKQFNVKTLNSFVRVMDIAGQFQLTTEQVQLSLGRKIEIGGLSDKEKYYLRNRSDVFIILFYFVNPIFHLLDFCTTNKFSSFSS